MLSRISSSVTRLSVPRTPGRRLGRRGSGTHPTWARRASRRRVQARRRRAPPSAGTAAGRPTRTRESRRRASSSLSICRIEIGEIEERRRRIEERHGSPGDAQSAASAAGISPAIETSVGPPSHDGLTTRHVPCRLDVQLSVFITIISMPGLDSELLANFNAIGHFLGRVASARITRTMDTILVIDDERNIRTLVSRVLAQDDVEVHTAGTGKEGLELAEELSPDGSLVDLRLPDMDGIQVVRELKAKHPDSAVIMITAFGHIESAVAAIKTGATDYLEKPFQHLEKLRISVSRALDEVKARREITRVTKREEAKYRTDQLIGESDSTRRLRDIIGQLARSEAHTVLIHGESGTGKELEAKGLHYESARRNFPFMEVSCAAITETLFESELFGHEKGAFTAARATKKGLMEMADRGTLFLDEVGEMAQNSQAKLLRCLQERMFKRVGGTRDIKVDVRVIAATNRSLETMVKEGKFREDLFYRLNVIPITIPPLRERTEDILPLARHFLTEANRTFHKMVRRFAPETEVLLLGYAWPGNVRELKNLVERTVILSIGESIDAHNLPAQFSQLPEGRSAEDATPTARTLAAVERSYILKVMQQVKGNKSEAAKVLGITRQTLRKKLTEV